MKKCMICNIVTDVKEKNLGEKNYGSIVAILFGKIFKEAWNYMEVPYEMLEAKETKCFLRGDPYGEITVTFAKKL